MKEDQVSSEGKSIPEYMVEYAREGTVAGEVRYGNRRALQLNKYC
jgi:hypothetical protein